MTQIASITLTSCSDLPTYVFHSLWLLQAAKLMGQKLGGELVTAAKEAHKIGSALILGDRLFEVTIQRAFDCLSLFDRCKVGVMMVWEVLTMSLFRIRDYVTKSETDESFIGDEIAQIGIICQIFLFVLFPIIAHILIIQI